MMPLLTFTLVKRVARVVHHRIDFRAQIHGVGDQAFLVGLQVEDAGIAGVGGAFEDGDGALHQVQAGGVLELETEQRELGVGVLVVDGDALALDVLVDDGQHGRLLPGQGHRLVDRVLEEIAELTRRRRVVDALGQVQRRSSAFVQSL